MGMQLRAQQKPTEMVTVRGITKPSVERKLQFITPGLIREVKVKEGDIVKVGQPLIIEDDRIEANLLEALRHEASSTVRIDTAKADMDLKKVQLDRWEKLFKENGSNATEVEEAKMKWLYAKGQMQVAELDRDKAKFEADRQAIKVDQMKLVSQIDGVVATLNVRQGELAAPSADRDAPIILVANDPLWAEFQLPTAQSSRLKLQDKLEVRHANDPENQWTAGAVTFISPYANASSDTQTVRVELPNPQKRASGMQVFVKLPDAVSNPAVANVPQP
jgi:RND family efflux transporter MFP subunit